MHGRLRTTIPWATLRAQVRHNVLALISFGVALTSVSYNTWRDERTEYNRNVRAAAFQMLTKLADFERTVFLSHYDRDPANGNPRIGWTDVIVIHDLATVAPAPLESTAATLRTVWRDNWERLAGDDESSVDQSGRILPNITRRTDATTSEFSIHCMEWAPGRRTFKRIIPIRWVRHPMTARCAATVARAMMIGCWMGAVLLYGCGGKPAAPADVTIVFDGPSKVCEIRRAGQTQAHSVPCLDVVFYLTHTVELPKGSQFDYETIPYVNVAEFERVMSDLHLAGYRPWLRIHVGFLTEPDAAHPQREGR